MFHIFFDQKSKDPKLLWMKNELLITFFMNKMWIGSYLSVTKIYELLLFRTKSWNFLNCLLFQVLNFYCSYKKDPKFYMFTLSFHICASIVFKAKKNKKMNKKIFYGFYFKTQKCSFWGVQKIFLIFFFFSFCKGKLSKFSQIEQLSHH